MARCSFRFLLFVSALCLSFSLFSCNKDEEVRQPADIMGTWAENSSHFLQFRDDNIVRPFTILEQDGETFGKWEKRDVYYYEPGYNLVLYLNSEFDASVYQIVELTDTSMVWCWVDSIEEPHRDTIGQIIGNIINKAQEGYELNPELYQYFTRVSEEEFLEILDKLEMVY